MRFAGLLARRNPALQPVKDPIVEGRLFTSRATIGFMSIAAALFLLLVRFSWLQVIGYDEFATRSISNRVRVVPVTPNRGLIYDRRGRSIAENVPAYRLELVPEKVTELKATIRRLGEIVELPADALERFQRNRTRHRDFDSVPLKFNLNNDEVARFAVNRHRFPGVEIVPYLARRYPYSDLLTHVVGYVGRLDDNDLARVDAGNYRGTTHIGKSGIERYYEDGLHGVSGLEKVETNAEGRVLRVLEREDPVHGEDLILSLDMYVQEVAWYALGNRAGAVVAVDPQDGAILAMVSKPGFDPNDFVHGISSADYRAILGSPNRPLFNRALQGGYEPGSTIKPFVGLAGLELGVTDPEKKVWSGGQFFLSGQERPFRDWKVGGHGWVAMESALEQSVNTYFYQLALDLGIDQMHDYLALFGFGARTGLDLNGENSGILPSRDWKRGRYGEPWYPGETVIAGIGQGFNVVTPVQLAIAVAALANGGTRFSPRLLYASKKNRNEQARKVNAPVIMQVPIIDPGNWDVIREGMRRVVHGEAGTARGIKPPGGFEIAGKSGTAQVTAQAEGETYQASEVAQHLRHHALFVAFAPADQPLIAVAAVVEHGGGGSREAAPVARAVIDAWLLQELDQ
jgi:penicillin-binding protein 2